MSQHDLELAVGVDFDRFLEAKDGGVFAIDHAAFVDSPARFRIVVECLCDRMSSLFERRLGRADLVRRRGFRFISYLADLQLCQHKVAAVGLRQTVFAQRVVSQRFQTQGGHLGQIGLGKERVGVVVGRGAAGQDRSIIKRPQSGAAGIDIGGTQQLPGCRIG